ncbi:hypothetical protein BVX94_03135 [bacterium B17]|nr:hypothetical protein BVX94_03135 [bacterium B17]
MPVAISHNKLTLMTDKFMGERKLEGLALSSGIASGRVCMFNEGRHSTPPLFKIESAGIEYENARVKNAIKISRGQLDVIKKNVL